jgi:hypothetical protein
MQSEVFITWTCDGNPENLMAACIAARNRLHQRFGGEEEIKFDRPKLLDEKLNQWQLRGYIDAI